MCLCIVCVSLRRESEKSNVNPFFPTSLTDGVVALQTSSAGGGEGGGGAWAWLALSDFSMPWSVPMLMVRRRVCEAAPWKPFGNIGHEGDWLACFLAIRLGPPRPLPTQLGSAALASGSRDRLDVADLQCGPGARARRILVLCAADGAACELVLSGKGKAPPPPS